MKAGIETSESVKSDIGNEITLHLDREVTQGFQHGWKNKNTVMAPNTLIEKLLGIAEIRTVTLRKRYMISLKSKGDINWNEVIPSIGKILKEHFKEEIEYVELEKGILDDSREIPLYSRIIFKDFERFSSPIDKKEKQPKTVQKLFEKAGITEIHVQPDKITLKRARLFPWDKILSDINEFFVKHKEAIEEDEANVSTERRALLERIIRTTPNPQLPILKISTEGDSEGKTSKSLGTWNGKTEDVLRKVAPSIMYEVSVIFYSNPSKMIEGVRDYGLPDISFASAIPKKDKKVTVRLYSEKNANEFVESLSPETHYEFIGKSEILVEV